MTKKQIELAVFVAAAAVVAYLLWKKSQGGSAVAGLVRTGYGNTGLAAIFAPDDVGSGIIYN